MNQEKKASSTFLILMRITSLRSSRSGHARLSSIASTISVVFKINLTLTSLKKHSK